MYASQTDNKYVLLFCLDIVVIIVVVIDVVSVIIMRREARYDTIITIKVYFSYRDEGRHTLLSPPLLNTVEILSSSSSSLFFLPLLLGKYPRLTQRSRASTVAGTNRDNFFVLAK
jgi:hypothetical protein